MRFSDGNSINLNGRIMMKNYLLILSSLMALMFSVNTLADQDQEEADEENAVSEEAMSSEHTLPMILWKDAANLRDHLIHAIQGHVGSSPANFATLQLLTDAYNRRGGSSGGCLYGSLSGSCGGTRGGCMYCILGFNL